MERPQGKEKCLNRRLRGGGTWEVARKCGGRVIKERGMRLEEVWGSPYKSWAVEEIRVGTRAGRVRGPRGGRNMGMSDWAGGRGGGAGCARERAGRETEAWVLPPNPPAPKTHKTGC